MSRYSHRTSAGSGFLDPNSQVVGEGKYFIYTFHKIHNALHLFTIVYYLHTIIWI